MKIRGDWLDAPQTQAMMQALTAAGYQAYFVGGCVRNTLLGLPVKDVDIATDALPDAVKDVAEANGMKAIPTGEAHGTITVISGETPFEITTFRCDIDTDGRRAVVTFSKKITDDARRRDFTMNALYADRTGDVIDPLGGLPDLQARRLRFIEDPAQRIREDYLRILRYFRFHAWYGDDGEGMDANALAAISTHLDGLAQLSRERVGGEMLRLLEAPDPVMSVAVMRQTGVLHAVLPGAIDDALGPLTEHERIAGVPPDALRRLACLGGENVVERLRLSKAEAKVLGHLRDHIGSMAPPIELGYRLGAALGMSVMLLRAAILEEPVDLDGISQGAVATFPLSAVDLMPSLSGPELGQTLRQLEDRWLASGCTLSKAELLSGMD